MMMREKLGKAIKNSAMNASRMSAANIELNNNWLKKLDATAVTGEAKDAQSQLSSVLDFYNKQASGAGKPIDWDGFRERIHTPGVVDKIKAKYDKFMESTYAVEPAVSKLGHQTEQMQQLDIAMQYNFALYYVHYQLHLDQLETMQNTGDITKMSNMEMMGLCEEVEVCQQSQTEIGDISPEDYNEDGIVTRICTQFSWGSRYTVPFNHSQDAISSIVATMGKNGK